MRSKRRNLRKQVPNRFSMYNMDPRLPKNQPIRRPSNLFDLKIKNILIQYSIIFLENLFN